MTMLDANQTILTWIQDHWVVIALVASEAMAFIPGKAKGIVQSAFKVLGKIFSKSND